MRSARSICGSRRCVFRTADHGELGGSHGGLRGKGPLPYEQETHVPAVIVHPEYPGGRNCHALTSHIDLIPTLAGLTNTDKKFREAAVAGLPGHDFSSLLAAPDKAPAGAIREGVLFNYVGLQTVDALYMIRVCHDIAKGRFAPPFTEAKPDMTGRGFISFTFDGRYKFARYYAPMTSTRPRRLRRCSPTTRSSCSIFRTILRRSKTLGSRSRPTRS